MKTKENGWEPKKIIENRSKPKKVKENRWKPKAIAENIRKSKKIESCTPGRGSASPKSTKRGPGSPGPLFDEPLMCHWCARHGPDFPRMFGRARLPGRGWRSPSMENVRKSIQIDENRRKSLKIDEHRRTYMKTKENRWEPKKITGNW